MNKFLVISIFFLEGVVLYSQNASRDVRMGTGSYLRSERSAIGKGENEVPSNRMQSAQGNENVSYSANEDMITIVVESGENKIQLLALTGQMLFNGNLNQGRFVIPTQRGIYILKINSRSYKVVCK
jgi:hypothetical protein